MSETMKKLREILSEQFGPRADAIQDGDKPWHANVGAKTIDVLDFKLFIEEQFGPTAPHAHFYDDASLEEIARYLETVEPNTSPC